jgi:predicted O-methyltransferase YrrM
MNPNRLIRQKLNIKHHDYPLPFIAWDEITRAVLAELFTELGFKVGAEIGVASGKFSQFLLDNVPELQLYCIDPYMAFARTSERVSNWRRRKAHQRLADYNATFVEMTSLDAVQDFEDGSLDFVFIDGDHRFDAVMLDLILWTPKVRKGGIISGHDYIDFYQSGVRLAADTYTRAHGINQWYITREKITTFLWVQQ